MREVLTTALGPTTIGDLDDDFQTISPTSFNEDVVLPLQWRPGLACIWDNRRFLHSTVPIQIYSEGSRVMWQIIHRVGDIDDEEEQYLAAYYNKRSKAEETPKL